MRPFTAAGLNLQPASHASLSRVCMCVCALSLSLVLLERTLKRDESPSQVRGCLRRFAMLGPPPKLGSINVDVRCQNDALRCIWLQSGTQNSVSQRAAGAPTHIRLYRSVEACAVSQRFCVLADPVILSLN